MTPSRFQVAPPNSADRADVADRPAVDSARASAHRCALEPDDVAVGGPERHCARLRCRRWGRCCANRCRGGRAAGCRWPTPRRRRRRRPARRARRSRSGRGGAAPARRCRTRSARAPPRRRSAGGARHAIRARRWPRAARRSRRRARSRRTPIAGASGPAARAAAARRPAAEDCTECVLQLADGVEAGVRRGRDSPLDCAHQRLGQARNARRAGGSLVFARAPPRDWPASRPRPGGAR